MEISYDALRRMIQKEIEALSKSEDNNNIQVAKPSEQSTREYCKELVKGELSKEFIQSLNRIEKAAAGKLDKD